MERRAGVCASSLCGRRLSRSSCLNYLHRLGFVLKRPKKRLSKADEAARAAFVSTYHDLHSEARRTGAKIFFVDEAHFRADVRPACKVGAARSSLPWSTRRARAWVRKPVTTLVSVWRRATSSSCDVPETCTAETSTLFLTQLRTEPS